MNFADKASQESLSRSMNALQICGDSLQQQAHVSAKAEF